MKIALLGRMRTGKDTAGQFLIDAYNFKRYAFGDAIGNVIKDYFYDAFCNGKPRGHYQVIGQTFRSLDADVWINAIDKQLKKEAAENIVITDLRQLNEYEYLKDNGFIIVKIECDLNRIINRIEQNGDVFKKEQLNHETELYIDSIPYDYKIVNTGTIEDLYKQLTAIIESEEAE